MNDMRNTTNYKIFLYIVSIVEIQLLFNWDLTDQVQYR